MSKINIFVFELCLTQERMLPIKYENIIVYSDGVSHKLWQSQGDMLHPILLYKSQDVIHSPLHYAAW